MKEANPMALHAKLSRRLEELKGEFEKGRARLGQIEGEAAELRQKILRISGAIQVLEEELAEGSDNAMAPPES